MKKKRTVIFLAMIVVAILFAGKEDLYAGAGVPNPWGIISPIPSGTKWTGNLVITGQIVNVPGLPANLAGWPKGLPPDAQPVDPASGYTDPIATIEFFVRLENKNQGYFTFSGVAIDNSGYYLFYPLADHATGRIGEALNRFLKDKVYPNLKPFKGGDLTDLSDDVTNLDIQLSRGLQPGTPLYYNANITVVTHK